MSNEIEVTCRIPAPPDGWVYDGWRTPEAGSLHLKTIGAGYHWMEPPTDPFENHHCAVRAPAEPVYEANELVRFFDAMSWGAVVAIDATGGVWITSQRLYGVSDWIQTIAEPLSLTELHPRLTVRRDVIGDTSTDLLAFPIAAGMQVRGQCYPCDQQGNPLGQERNQAPTSGDDSILPEMLAMLETAARFAGEYHSMTREPRTEDYWIHRENLEANYEATKEAIDALLKRVKGEG